MDRAWVFLLSAALGCACRSQTAAPIVVPQPRALAAGGAHTCALWSQGQISCWGRNEYGELGDGTQVGRTKSTPVVGLSGVLQIAAGGGGAMSGHSCAVTASKEVRCWGYNGVGQLGDGTNANRSTPVAIAGLVKVEQVALGESHSCARKTEGTVYCWGRGDSGQLGNGGLTDQSRPVAVIGLSDAVELSVGYYHACARRANGSVVCWGGNNHGEIGNGSNITALVPASVPGLPAVVEVAAGGFTTCARTSEGSVFCWGSGEYGQLGNGTTGSESFSTTPLRVQGLENATQLALGGAHVCLRRTDGTVACWGSNAVGQVGVAGAMFQSMPRSVGGAMGGVDLEAGAKTTFLRRASEAVLSWGGNADGQLGDGTKEDRKTPVALPALAP